MKAQRHLIASGDGRAIALYARIVSSFESFISIRQNDRSRRVLIRTFMFAEHVTWVGIQTPWQHRKQVET